MMSGMNGVGEADSGTNVVIFECGKKEIFTPAQGFKVRSRPCPTLCTDSGWFSECVFH